MELIIIKKGITGSLNLACPTGPDKIEIYNMIKILIEINNRFSLLLRKVKNETKKK